MIGPICFSNTPRSPPSLLTWAFSESGTCMEAQTKITISIVMIFHFILVLLNGSGFLLVFSGLWFAESVSEVFIGSPTRPIRLCGFLLEHQPSCPFLALDFRSTTLNRTVFIILFQHIQVGMKRQRSLRAARGT